MINIRVLVAGTFDQLHNGHKMLLNIACEFAKYGSLTVGLTSDEYVKRKHHLVRPYLDRKEDLWDYLLKKKISFQISQIDGNIPTKENIENIIDWEGLEYILVSIETNQGALEFNKARNEMGLSSLKIIEIPTLPAYDGERISSTRIHNKEIDLKGNKVQ